MSITLANGVLACRVSNSNWGTVGALWPFWIKNCQQCLHCFPWLLHFSPTGSNIICLVAWIRKSSIVLYMLSLVYLFFDHFIGFILKYIRVLIVGWFLIAKLMSLTDVKFFRFPRVFFSSDQLYLSIFSFIYIIEISGIIFRIFS